MSTLLFTIGILFFSFFGFGIGIFLFKKRGLQDGACGSPPKIDGDKCLGQEAGLCPIEDTTGAVKLAKRGQLNYRDK